MNSKVEKSDRLSPLDVIKLVLAAAVLIFTVWAYYHYSAIATPLRIVGAMAGLGIAVVIASFTAWGAKAREFMRESQFEMRKVVWPTRQETIRTTIMIIIVTVVIALVLGLIDVVLKWAILDTLLQVGG